MGPIVVTAYVWLFFILTLILLFPFLLFFWIISLPFDPRHDFFHLITARSSRLYLLINPYWNFKVIDCNKLERNEVTVMVSNHQSLLDALLIFQLPIRFKWVSKKELFRVPVLGWLMTMNAYISVRRGDSNSRSNMMLRCKEELKRGCSVFFFSEGTRSNDGTLGQFKSGAFELALDEQKTIQPILIDGPASALPKNRFLLRKNTRMIVKVLDRIPYESFKSKLPQIIAEDVREIINRELQSLRSNINEDI